MTSTANPSEPSRISLNLDPSLYRTLERAAASRGQTIGQYVLAAIDSRLWMDQQGDRTSGADSLLTASDPVLTELWDNPHDAAYDRL